jgi:hypothetical protein
MCMCVCMCMCMCAGSHGVLKDVAPSYLGMQTIPIFPIFPIFPIYPNVYYTSLFLPMLCALYA